LLLLIQASRYVKAAKYNGLSTKNTTVGLASGRKNQ